MLFPESHEPDLKTWIVKQIENTPDADADADVLADYVLALLKHDGDLQDVRKICENNLPDFLGKDTIPFVNNILEGITYRSYLPNAPPRPPKNLQHSSPPQQQLLEGGPMSGLSYDDGHSGHGGQRSQQHLFSRSAGSRSSRKRGYKDMDNPNNATNNQSWMDAYNNRAFKQFRRGRGGMYEDGVSRNGSGPASSACSQGQISGQNLYGSNNGSNGGVHDLQSMFNISMQNMRDLLAVQSQVGGGQQQRKRPRCRDFDKKGVCPRGMNCNFEHITGEEAASNNNSFPFSAVEEYDPMMPLFPTLPGQSGPMFGDPQQISSRPRGGKNYHRQKKDHRAAFSAEGPVFDKSKSTIVVESIPEENFSEEQVRGFFSQFGTIMEVTMHAYKRLAVVKFDKWASANAAYNSPKVIFDNRFVKVFWHKDDGGQTGENGHNRGLSSTPGTENPSMSETELEEFRRRQEEMQKNFEEKARQREEVERQREQVETLRKDLEAKQAEAKKKLKTILAKRNGGKAPEEGGSEDGQQKDSSKPMTQTEALRAQLAALEEEARQMGLDPDALDGQDHEPQYPHWAPRGGSRGRGGWRGTTYFPRARGWAPRGRGAYRGLGDVHAAYAAYSLDNRPKKVVVAGVDFTVSGNDEMLRQYLFGIGEFTDVQITPESTEVTFKDRKTAEKFFNSVLLNDKTIPEVEGQVDVSWGGSANGSSGSVPTTPGLRGSSGNGSSKEDGEPDDNDDDDEKDHHHHNNNESSDDKDVRILLDRPTDQNEMDYEVAEDEGQWGY